MQFLFSVNVGEYVGCYMYVITLVTSLVTMVMSFDSGLLTFNRSVPIKGETGGLLTSVSPNNSSGCWFFPCLYYHYWERRELSLAGGSLKVLH